MPDEEVPYETELARLQMQREVEAARQISQMKQSTVRGKTFKVRYSDRSMQPTLQVNDLLEMGAFSLMKLKAGDLVYYRHQETYFVRRISGRTAMGDGVAYTVRAEGSTQDEVVAGNQILGKVISVQRGSQVIVFERPGVGFKLDAETILARLSSLIDQARERIQDLLARIRRK